LIFFSVAKDGNVVGTVKNNLRGCESELLLQFLRVRGVSGGEEDEKKVKE
jgi:hypothetical protein